MGVLSIFAAEKSVFIREYGAGLYRLPAYFISRNIVEIPFKIIFCLIGMTIIYFMIGYQEIAGKYFIMVLVGIVQEFAGTALGIFMASLFEDIAVALAVTPMALMPLMIFSGFFVNSSTIPVFLNWIKWLSPMKYAFVALVKNEFSGLKLDCTDSQLISSTNSTGGVEYYCPFTKGEQEITLLGFDDQGSIAVNIVILGVLYFGLLFLAYIALWKQVKKRV